jgi:hypothetical protein
MQNFATSFKKFFSIAISGYVQMHNPTSHTREVFPSLLLVLGRINKQLEVGTDLKVAVGKVHFKVFSLSYWENAPTIYDKYICLFYDGEQVVGPNQIQVVIATKVHFKFYSILFIFISVLGTSWVCSKAPRMMANGYARMLQQR